MKIRTFYKLDDDRYNVRIITEDWSERDQQLMEKFGEPEINLGGIFGDSPIFTLDDNLVRIMSDSPFLESFDFRDYSNAQWRAETWAMEISHRITQTLIFLRAQSDTFTHENVVEV